MPDNLLVFNMPECIAFEQRKKENCVEQIAQCCEEKLGIEHSSEIKVDWVHRLGYFKQNNTRPIVVKYNYNQDKQWMIKRSAFDKLQGTEFRVKDQFPKEIGERRKSFISRYAKSKERG